MTPYPNTLWYHVQDGLETLAHEPIVGAVPYMLARPMPIETAPRDGTAILAYIPYEDGGNWWPTHWDCGWRAIDGPGGRASHWIPLPPAPEEA